MNAPLAEFADYEGLRAALNRVRDHRAMPLSVLNDLVGCPTGYFEKLLGTRAVKRIGLQSLGWAFGALGVKCVIIEDPEAWARIAKHHRYRERDQSHFEAVMRGGTTQIVLSKRHMSIIQAKGRRSRWENMTEKQKRAWGKRMAKSRWKKQKQRARQRRETHKRRAAGTTSSG